VSLARIDLKITKVQMEQTQLRVQIWDTSGDDKYLSITKGDLSPPFRCARNTALT